MADKQKKITFGELDDDALSEVSGGETNRTTMRCSVCSAFTTWAGNYVGASYDCPRCGGKGTYQGVDGYEFVSTTDPEPRTKMRCSVCSAFTTWAGNYVGASYDCPRCGGKGTYRGYSV